MSSNDKRTRRIRRHYRIRKNLRGTAERPRMCVFRGLRHLWVQVIDDTAGRTLMAASTHEKDFPVATGGNVEAAKALGKRVAERALQNGIKQVVFDRGGNLYHGRVKALADAAREGGLTL